MYKIWLIVIVVGGLAVISLTRDESVEDYFWNNYEGATEILYHDSF